MPFCGLGGGEANAGLLGVVPVGVALAGLGAVGPPAAGVANGEPVEALWPPVFGCCTEAPVDSCDKTRPGSPQACSGCCSRRPANPIAAGRSAGARGYVFLGEGDVRAVQAERSVDDLNYLFSRPFWSGFLSLGDCA